MFNDNESTESKFMTKQEINAQEQMRHNQLRQEQIRQQLKKQQEIEINKY